MRKKQNRGGKTRGIAYFVVVRLSECPDGTYNLDIIRSTKNDKYAKSTINVKVGIIKHYMDLVSSIRRGNGEVSITPFLLKAKISKVWKDKHYDIVLTPLMPDRAVKVATPFMTGTDKLPDVVSKELDDVFSYDADDVSDSDSE